MEIGDIVKDKITKDTNYNKYKIVSIGKYKGKKVYELKDMIFIGIPTIWRYEEDIALL